MRILSLAFVFSILIAGDGSAQERPTPAKGRSALLAALEVRYGRAQGSATIQQDGLLAGNKANLIYIENKIVNGQLLPTGRAAGMVPNVTLTPGQQVYVMKIEAKSNLLRLHIRTVDSYDYGHTEPFKMVLSFQVPKNYLDTAALEDVQAMIDPFLTPPGAQAPTDIQPDVPQPIYAQPAPARITLGQTIDQVTAVLGLPEQIIDLGPRQIYRYKDLKVTFINGKVTDVQ